MKKLAKIGYSLYIVVLVLATLIIFLSRANNAAAVNEQAGLAAGAKTNAHSHRNANDGGVLYTASSSTYNKTSVALATMGTITVKSGDVLTVQAFSYVFFSANPTSYVVSGLSPSTVAGNPTFNCAGQGLGLNYPVSQVGTNAWLGYLSFQCSVLTSGSFILSNLVTSTTGTMAANIQSVGLYFHLKQ
jgi:hypothetical protein